MKVTYTRNLLAFRCLSLRARTLQMVQLATVPASSGPTTSSVTIRGSPCSPSCNRRWKNISLLGLTFSPSRLPYQSQLPPSRPLIWSGYSVRMRPPPGGDTFWGLSDTSSIAHPYTSVLSELPLQELQSRHRNQTGPVDDPPKPVKPLMLYQPSRTRFSFSTHWARALCVILLPE